MYRLALFGLLFAIISFGATETHAQSFPSKSVRLIVPFPPGGPADLLGRVYAEKLSAAWSQPVVVENRAGAAGNIASDMTAKASPDGYTVLLIASSHVINSALYDKLPYDPIKDFTPISQVAYYSLVLVAHPSVLAQSLTELVALARAQPGKLVLVSAGNGTPTHLTAELFLAPAGLPPEILKKLSMDIVAITKQDDLKARFAKMGIEALGSTPEQLSEAMQADLVKWSAVIRNANIKPD